MLNLKPNSATIHAVIVVPMFAPKMTPTDKTAGKHRRKAVVGHNCQKAVQTVSRTFLNAFAERFHPIQKQCEASGKLKYNRYNVHVCSLTYLA